MRSSRTTQIVLKTRLCGLQNKYRCHSSLGVTSRLNLSWHFHQNESCNLPSVAAIKYATVAKRSAQNVTRIGSQDASVFKVCSVHLHVVSKKEAGWSDISSMISESLARLSAAILCVLTHRLDVTIVSLFVGRQRTLSSGPFFPPFTLLFCIRHHYNTHIHHCRSRIWEPTGSAHAVFITSPD